MRGDTIQLLIPSINPVSSSRLVHVNKLLTCFTALYEYRKKMKGGQRENKMLQNSFNYIKKADMMEGQLSKKKKRNVKITVRDEMKE